MSILGPYQDHIGLWQNELTAWMPGEFFDVHVHLSPAEVIRPISAERRKEGLTAFTRFTWEEAVAWYGDLFSGKKIAGLIAFPLPMREVRLEAANEYIVGLMRREPRVKGFILADPKDAKKTIRQFDEALRMGARFSGVKPYYDLLGKSNYETIMPEFIPEELLEFMNDRRLIMMLHTSGIGVGDPENQKYLKSITARFPRIKIILAHMGRYVKVEQFFAFVASDVLDCCPSIFLESSYVGRPEIYQKVLARKELWPRLLFGTDLPWGLWMGHEGRKPGDGPPTWNAYHTVKAIKDAIEGLHLADAAAEQLKKDIFLENAQALFGSTI